MNFIPRMSRLIVAATLMAGSPGSAHAASALAPALAHKGGAAAPFAGAKAPKRAAYANLPLFFEKNHGQTDASVKYFTRASGYNLYLTATEAVMVMARSKAAKIKAPVVVRMKLKGANAQAAVQGRNILPGHTSYMRGNDRSKWQLGVEQYAKVKFSSVYPGIDMVYYGNKGQVEHDFIVAPGANPGRILVGFEGAKSLRLDPRGNLILGVEGGEVTYKAPTLYQRIGGKQTRVNGRFVLAPKNQVRFEVGDYIKSRELVIDPALGYSSFLGGSGATEDKAYAIAVDDARNAYLTGTTNSPDFPTAGPPIQALKGVGDDLFVTKVNPAGTLIVWSTYLGGATDETGLGIAVDGPSGRAYVTGSVSGGGSVPGSTLLTGALGALTGINAFVVGIAADGLSTTANVTFGGDGDDIGRGIAIDSAENIYLTGETTTLAANTFPVMGTAQPVAGGGAQQAYVMKFTKLGVQVFGAYLGGTGFAYGRAIAVDGLNGSVYITGNTGDDFFTTLGAFKPTWGGAGGSAEGDAFIARMTADGSSYDYKTYVGGAIDDEATSIAVDSAKDVYITGYTYSPDFPDNAAAFATVAGLGGGRTTLSTAPDAFVFKLRIGNGGGHSDGVYATFLGGSTDDRGTGIVVDSAFNAYVAGTTTSGDFPSVGANPDAGQGTFIGTPEAFVTEIDNTGGPLVFSTYLGGTGATNGQGLALDSLKNIYVTGYTGSGAGTFPLVAGGFQQTRGTGTNTAFVTKFGAAVPPPLCTITTRAPSSGYAVGGATITITGTEFNGLAGLSAVTFDGVNASSYTVNATSTVITAVAPPHALGTVPLVVTTNGGTCATTYDYVALPVCTITIRAPVTGFTIGGTTVTITGTEFNSLVGLSAVTFDGVNTSSYSVNAASTVITAVTPVHLVAGSVTALVTTSGGTCSTTYLYTTAAAACGNEIFYPSPATGAVGTFSYCMEASGDVKIKVYNAIGDLAAKIEDSKPSGAQLSTVNTARLAPGVYLYLLEKNYGGGHSVRSGVKKFVVKH